MVLTERGESRSGKVGLGLVPYGEAVMVVSGNVWRVRSRCGLSMRGEEWRGWMWRGSQGP